MKIRCTTLFFAGGLLLFVQPTQAFTVGECVAHLTRGVDPQFRLPEARATARCVKISNRIDRLSRLALGYWMRRSESGHLESMDFTPGGRVRVHAFNYGSRRMEDTVQTWRFDNPYGTVGAEVLQLDDGTLSSVRFTDRAMTITSQPASATIIEHWTRAR